MIQIASSDNIFTRLLFSAITNSEIKVTFMQNNSVQKAFSENLYDLYLLPSLEITHTNNLFVSQKIGIAFDGFLSPDFIYYSQSENLKKVNLIGDYSMNEVILPKVVFREVFAKEIEIEIEKNINPNENLIVCGNSNFKQNKFEKGDSLSELISNYLEAPYLKYIFVSKSKEPIVKINQFAEIVAEMEFDDIAKNKYFLEFSENELDIIKSEWNSIYFRLTDLEIDSFDEFRKIPFYYGLVDEMKEIAFI